MNIFSYVSGIWKICLMLRQFVSPGASKLDTDDCVGVLVNLFFIGVVLRVAQNIGCYESPCHSVYSA